MLLLLYLFFLISYKQYSMYIHSCELVYSSILHRIYTHTHKRGGGVQVYKHINTLDIVAYIIHIQNVYRHYNISIVPMYTTTTP